MSAFNVLGPIVFGTINVLTLIAFAQGSAPVGGSGIPGRAPLYGELSGGPTRTPFPSNVDCRDYDKAGEETWKLRSKANIDLGSWLESFYIQGRILPRRFVKNGIDLYDVLERKCEIYAM